MIAEEHLRNLLEAIAALRANYPTWKERVAAEKIALAKRDAAIEFLRNQEAIERIVQRPA